MSGERRFFDTNVLVYLFDDDEPRKQTAARELLADGGGFVLGAQVLGEFFVTVTRKLARPLPLGRARDAIVSLAEFPVQPITATLVNAAIERVERSRLSYWDALIVETSIAAAADVLSTEDMQNGQVFDGVRIDDPFADPS